MTRIVLLTFIVLTFKPYSSSSQEYSYTYYDISDGLAGSTAYSITQDKEGFIWIGTETGVSRLDGTHFKNFRWFARRRSGADIWGFKGESMDGPLPSVRLLLL